jgi:hypothetical protein
MTLCNTEFAMVEQDASSKVPILLPGDLNASVIREYVESCKGYFDNKDIAAEKQVCRILAGIKDSHYRDWISSDRPRIQSLNFDDFIAKFKKNYLNDRWEAKMHHELLTMTQGPKSFWDWAITVAVLPLVSATSDSLVIPLGR